MMEYRLTFQVLGNNYEIPAIRSLKCALLPYDTGELSFSVLVDFGCTKLGGG